MAGCNKTSPIQTPKAFFSFFLSSIFISFDFLPYAIAKPLNFSFPTFGPNAEGIEYQGNATAICSGEIELTVNRLDASLNNSVGRAICDQPLHLWDKKTRKMADFTTHFSFSIRRKTRTCCGDGLAFFLATSGTGIPPNSAGGFLGLFSNKSIVNSPPAGKMVAVEFDSHKDGWDPSDDHVGININGIVSVKSVPWNASIKNDKLANAWVSYNSSTHNLSVFLAYDENPIFGSNPTLYHIVDLREILPEWVNFGFSAATGNLVELHQIHSWNFSSSDIDEGGKEGKKVVLGIKRYCQILAEAKTTPKSFPICLKL